MKDNSKCQIYIVHFEHIDFVKPIIDIEGMEIWPYLFCDVAYPIWI
jgi:hypothetical protein